jgi:hypothetical protein
MSCDAKTPVQLLDESVLEVTTKRLREQQEIEKRRREKPKELYRNIAFALADMEQTCSFADADGQAEETLDAAVAELVRRGHFVEVWRNRLLGKVPQPTLELAIFPVGNRPPGRSDRSHFSSCNLL